MRSLVVPVAKKSVFSGKISNFKDLYFQILPLNKRNDLYSRDQLVEYYQSIPLTAHIGKHIIVYIKHPQMSRDFDT